MRANLINKYTKNVWLQWDDNIAMDLKWFGWREVAQEKEKWWGVVNVLMNRRAV
jgi:hypothetical protein